MQNIPISSVQQKIWGAYLFQRLTDIYGNVPYSEAGLGYYQQIYKPKYDNQGDHL